MMAPAEWPTVEPKHRAVRGGDRLFTFSVVLEVVTPILGGGTHARELDEVDVIRPGSVRGQLRFWWRALHGHEARFARPEDLYAAEGDLWGRVRADAGRRSRVEIRVQVLRVSDSIDGTIEMQAPGAYALWTARAERNGTPAAPRRKAGTRFRLTVVGPAGCEVELRECVRTWVLFGGYGSRTRRGLGSLTVTTDPSDWLPTNATRPAFAELFGRDIFQTPDRTASQTPWLAGAALHSGSPARSGEAAWVTAVDWLREFRQGTAGAPGDRAREPGSGNRPSVSNWPEADKVRHLTNKIRAHEPRHNSTPAWPRAGFGLPIVGRFQTRGRDDRHLDEPGAFTLSWQPDGENALANRLASPLVLKALPLANGTWVPCALWLNRSYPTGMVVLDGRPTSRAPFDRLIAAGDRPVFRALDGHASIRSAFLAWLQRRHQTREIAP